MKKQMLFKIKGMNRDLSVSAFNPEFSFENMNLRLSTNGGNTLMSWVNEIGTKQLEMVTENDSGQATQTPFIISGYPVGTAILNHYLVLFTADSSGYDYILRMKYTDTTKTKLQVKVVCQSIHAYMELSTDHPLETLVSYESDKVQKVYWVDGIHQLRVVNINKSYGVITSGIYCVFDAVRELQLGETVKVEKQLSASGMFAPGVIQYAFTYYDKYGQESNIFYTSPLQYISYKDRGASPEDKVENAFKITVTGVDTQFDFLRIYSIQRTSVNGTPLCKRIQDISLEGFSNDPEVISRGYINSSIIPTVYVNGVPIASISSACQFTSSRYVFGQQVTCYGFIKSGSTTFEVKTSDYSATYGASSNNNSVIWVTDSKITYEGVYAYYVIETNSPSSDSPMEAMAVTAIKLPSISFIDTGMSGETVDPTELLYKGGDIISAETIEQKDNTLFMGGITLTRPSIVSIKNQVSVSITESATRSFNPVKISSGFYDYYSQLTSKGTSGSRHAGMTVPCGGFKTGEKYRLGIQFQHKSGKWSDPIYIGDKIAKGKFAFVAGLTTVPIFSGSLTSGASALTGAGYKRMRPVVVFPSMIDRNIICQGVTAPTVYTKNNRDTDSCYAQSSWFFRPLAKDDTEGTSLTTMCPKSATGYLRYTSRQISSTFPETKDVFNPQYIRQVEIEGDYLDDGETGGGNKFKIDRTNRTFHSPDIEFDDRVSLIDFTDKYFIQRGTAEFSCTMSDIDIQTETPTVSSSGAGFVHKPFSSPGAKGIVGGLFYDDFIVDDHLEGGSIGPYPNEKQSCKWLIYPWQGSGYLNNDMNRPSDKGIASSKLKKKVISNLRFAFTNLDDYSDSMGTQFSTAPQIFNSDEVSIIKIGNNIYKGNIDTMLTPDNSDGHYFCFNGWIENDINTPFNSTVWCKTFNKKPNSQDQNGIRKWNDSNEWEWGGNHIGDDYIDMVLMKNQVRMKYKSTPHLFGYFSNLSENNGQLAIVEIKQDVDDTIRFGGTSEDALRENTWIPCGEPVAIAANATLYWDYGDTYYQRWDCLKTYAFTREDINQVVEIGSFMLETRVNIDGRYDRNRGQSNNLNMSPQNFNLINPIYSQIDNFFTYRIMPDSFYDVNTYPNQITWSKTKENGANVDVWTNITLASVLELDGNKGKINKLVRFNNYLFAFQDSGIAQILYNDNVQISSTDGVPIEIANSGKVQGKDYKSDTIGCSNKWSIVNTPSGIYFMDSNDKSIYLFNGKLNNISQMGGFNSWCKQNIPSQEKKWTPLPYVENAQGINTGGFDNFVGYYDKMNQDVLYLNHKTALAWSERVQAFTSFYDYGNTPFFENLDDTGLWIAADLVNGGYKLWKHQAGNYGQFFGKNKPYWMTLVGNPEPQMDKVFTNLEFRACVSGDGTPSETLDSNGNPVAFTPTTPFDSLETWNEYQHGFTTLENKNGHSAMIHGGDSSALKRKFRIWRCNIPRNNCELDRDRPTPEPAYSEDAYLGVSRYSKKPMDRMRNPWLYLKLVKNAAVDEVVNGDTVEHNLDKAEIHDVVMTYFE